MARSKKKSNLKVVLIGIVCLVLGCVVGFVGYTYFGLPETEQLIVTEEVYYSYNDGEGISYTPISTADGTVSVHFLELGNKYTGDCTYIKVGENIDILIDCGSKSNSISTVSEYLNQYVTDNTLEYVIITHAHQDHYAGFATSTKVDSIFDLYECEVIIDFAKTNQRSTATTYNNYLRELNDEINNGAQHYTALQCWNEEDGAQQEYILDSENNISLEILYNYYYENNASSENDYSVCCMLNHGDRHFLFTGDLEERGEEYLVQYNELPQVTVYKAGHHGSKTSSTDALLSVIQPEIVCVCCCAGSSEYTSTPENQFPTQQFIDNVARYTKYIYVTTLCVDYENDQFTSFNGNIVIVAGDELGVNCSNNNTILKESEWFASSGRTWPEYGVV